MGACVLERAARRRGHGGLERVDPNERLGHVERLPKAAALGERDTVVMERGRRARESTYAGSKCSLASSQRPAWPAADLAWKSPRASSSRPAPR